VYDVKFPMNIINNCTKNIVGMAYIYFSATEHSIFSWQITMVNSVCSHA